MKAGTSWGGNESHRAHAGLTGQLMKARGHVGRRRKGRIEGWGTRGWKRIEEEKKWGRPTEKGKKERIAEGLVLKRILLSWRQLTMSLLLPWEAERNKTNVLQSTTYIPNEVKHGQCSRLLWGDILSLKMQRLRNHNENDAHYISPDRRIFWRESAAEW